MDFTERALAKANIYPDKLLKNIDQFKGILSKDTAFMAVVKADAYSHGAVKLAQIMETEEKVDYFGVAQLQEALELREGKIRSPILIFNSLRLEEIEQAIQKQVTMTVFSKELAYAIVKQAEQLKETATVHLKIDSGMGRIGFTNFKEAYQVSQILHSKYVHIEGIYTHFADASHKDPDNFTHEQFQQFKRILDPFEKMGVHFKFRHVCNTAATINFPEYQLDMVRVGIGLYGYDPTFTDEVKVSLHPIQNIHALVTQVKDFPANKSIGYQRTYFSKEEMRLATLAIGYADGVAKSLSNKGYFRYQDEKLPIVGQVCMDQLMIDSSAAPDLAAGDYLNYFGDPAENYSSANEIATLIDSSVYELLCRVSRRVERIYK